MNILDNLKKDSRMTPTEWRAFCNRYHNGNTATIATILRKRYHVSASTEEIQTALEEELSEKK